MNRQYKVLLLILAMLCVLSLCIVSAGANEIDVQDQGKQPAQLLILTYTNCKTEYTEGEYRYVFAGWSPAIEGVTEDITYIARYNSFLGPKATIEFDNALEAFAKHTILPAVAISVASIAVLMATIVLLKSSKKKKKKTNKIK